MKKYCKFCEVVQRSCVVSVHNELQVKSPFYKGIFCEKNQKFLRCLLLLSLRCWGKTVFFLYILKINTGTESSNFSLVGAESNLKLRA